MKQQLAEPHLAAEPLRTCFLYEFSLSHSCEGKSLQSCLNSLQTLVFAQLSSGSTTALQSGLDLKQAFYTLILLFFNHSVVDLLQCLGSLSCFLAIFTKFQLSGRQSHVCSRICLSTEEFVVALMSAEFISTVAATSPNHYSSILMLDR